MSQTCCTATLKTINYALLHIQNNYLYGATTTILIKYCYSGKCCLYSKSRDTVGDHIEQLRTITVYSLYVIEIVKCLAAELSNESTIDKNICDVISWPWNM